MEKFVEFLTSNIGDSSMKMWVLLVAIIAVIIILGIVIGVLWTRKDKKKKATLSDETATVEAIDEPAITAPPSMQNMDEIADTDTKEELIAPTTVKLDSQVNEPIEKESDADDLESANPPISETAKSETAETSAPLAEKTAAPITKATATTKSVAKEEKTIEVKATTTQGAEKPSENKVPAKPNEEKISEVIVQEKPIENKSSDTKAQEKPAIVAEVAADKAPAAKPIAKKVVAKKIAPTTKTETETAKTEPKKAKVVGTDALPKKVKNTIKLEEAKTVLETPANGESFGKYIIFKDERTNPNKPFKFALRANNGQLLFESEPYKVKPRETSIQAFKKHVQIGDFIVDEDKFGFFRFKLYTDAGKLLGVGESYKSRSSCESSIESVKRFSLSATVIEDTTLEEVTE